MFGTALVRLLTVSLMCAGMFVLRVQADELDAYFANGTVRSTMTVDHSTWKQILARYVVAETDGINRFAYGRVSGADKARLKTYLVVLQQVAARQLPRDEQMAFWINFYNALTIDVVLDHYPVVSIKDISLGGGLFTSGPWKKALVTVEGKTLSLDNIEHDILRKTWPDPRVHYSVNCASLSCPNLMAEPFTAARLNEMLDAGATAYVNHPRGVKVSGGKVYLSRIYSWYRSDFGTKDGEVIRHLLNYADSTLKRKLAGIETISGYDYDWSLNEAK
jgi:hypothetical protein